MLLRLENVARSFGSRTLFRDVAVSIHRSDRIGLVGANGTGKTTLLRIAAGSEMPDAGQVAVPRNVRIGILRQEIDPNRTTTVRAEVATVFSELEALERELSELESRMAEITHAHHEVPADLADRYDACRTRFELGGGFERESRIERVLAGLGFDQERAGRALNTFSGGWLMRVELAKLLLAAPDVLLLDEPTNHLDLPSIQWFEESVAEYPGAVVIISHDRTFLRRNVNRVAELENGALTVFEGPFDRYLTQKALRREELLARKQTQDRKIAETERFIDRFRAKASKAKQVQSRIKSLSKLDRVDVGEEKRSKMRLRIPPVTRSGDVVLRLEGIEKSYEETVVYEGVDLSLQRKDRVALVGPNGAGKSTLLRIAAGELPIDGGERTLGHNVKVAFFAQHQLEVLDAKRTVLEEIETAARIDDIPRLRGQLGAFLFSGDDVDKKVGILSGGEKSRLALAKLLLRPANFLVLDEPTNHLDLISREVLEEALAGYDGTLLLISHDRTFLNALVNRVVEVDGGILAEYPGNYDDYLRRSAQGAAPAKQATVSAKQATVSAAKVAESTTQETVSANVEDVATAAAPSSAETSGPPLSKRERIAARQVAKESLRRHQRNLKRLGEIEEEIREHEERLEALGWKLGDPELHRDPDGIRRLEADRDEIRSAVDALYEQWERLSAVVEAGDQVAS